MSRIAIISTGALGTCVGRALTRAGHDLRCNVSERSVATRRRAIDAGFIVTDTLTEAILESEFVISLVPPAQAVAVASRFAGCVRGRGRVDGRERIFVDGNSISPRTAVVIQATVVGAGASMVDASFFGPANSLGNDNLLVLSGPGAHHVAALFNSLVEVRTIGADAGAASAVKMSVSTLTKTLSALFLEAACASAASGQLDVTLDLLDRLYPGIMSFLARTLPTYRQHAARRLDEMRQIEDWLHDLGQSAAMARSGRETLARLALGALPAEECRNFREMVAAIATPDWTRGAMRRVTS